MVIDIKMCRFDNVPWGFRLVGGSDFEYPLTVVKVHEGSIAEEAGLRDGDVIVRINDTATSPLTHDEVNRLILGSGNVFFFGVQRESEEEQSNGPQMFPFVGQEPVATPDSFLSVHRPSQPSIEIRITPEPEDGSEREYRDEEEYITDLQDRPCSVMSENTEIKLVEEEIAAVLSGESEVLKDHNVMGIFPKPGVCMSSDVLRSLNEEATKTKAERDKENKKWTTFLQKPNRPIPKSKQQLEAERRAANRYKVTIVKNAPRSRSVSPAPSSRSVQEEKPPVEEKKPEPEPEPVKVEEPEPEPEPPKEPEVDEPPPTDSEVPNLEPVPAGEIVSAGATEQAEEEASPLTEEKDGTPPAELPQEEEGETPKEQQGVEQSPPPAPQPVKSEEELALERQLADVQRQLAALSTLPSTIQATLDAVTKQLADLLPTFKLQQGATVREPQEPRQINLERIAEGDDVTPVNEKGSRNDEAEPAAEATSTTAEGQQCDGNINDDTSGLRAAHDKQHLENGHGAGDGERQANMVDQEPDVAVAATAAGAGGDSAEHDSMMNMKKQKSNDVIDELNDHLERKNNPKRSKRAFGPLTPSSERPLVLPGGRRWYRPKDAYNDEFIAETLSAQAELIVGTALGNQYESPLLGYDTRVNFMKYQKPEKKIDLNRSEVYKVIHHLDRQPVRGIEVRPPKVAAEVDVRKAIES